MPLAALLPRLLFLISSSEAPKNGSKGSAQQTKSIRIMASFSSLSPIAESATVELSSRAKIRTAFCALIKKRRSKTVSTGAKSPSSFQVLRVRRFVLNDGDEAGSWQGIEEEPHCASNFDTAAINEGDVEVSLDSRYSSKEVLCGPVWDSQSSPDGQDTGRKHLISRIKRICRLRSTLDIGDDTSIEEPHAPWQPGSKSSGGPLSPTLSAGATLLKRVSSIIKREECLRAEEILGIDKRSMLKRLTDPHGTLLPRMLYICLLLQLIVLRPCALHQQIWSKLPHS